jgi:transcription initiation factor IIE alpha subunit
MDTPPTVRHIYDSRVKSRLGIVLQPLRKVLDIVYDESFINTSRRER